MKQSYLFNELEKNLPSNKMITTTMQKTATNINNDPAKMLRSVIIKHINSIVDVSGLSKTATRSL